MHTAEHEKIYYNIRKYAHLSTETKQVASRLLALLPSRLLSIKQDYCLKHKATRALRYALTNEKYQAYIDEYLKFFADSLEARIKWETHTMLLNAHRSTNSWRRHQITHPTKKQP